MYKILLYIALALLGIASCTKDRNIQITSLNIQQEEGELNFAITYSASSASFKSYEISYDIAANHAGAGAGSVFTSNNSLNTVKTLDELSLAVGTEYAFYARAAAEDNNTFSDWFGPVKITIGSPCPGPISASFTGGTLYWSVDNVQSSPISYYEVEYGIQGYTQGSGTVVTSNSKWTKDIIMEKGKAYDTYIRSYCSNNLGWGEWFGPTNYYADKNKNICTKPSNVGYFVERDSSGNAVGANITWDDLGYNQEYEYNIVSNNASPTSNAIESRNARQTTYLLTRNRDYDFYVRTVCVDGSRTDWVGPLNVNIGQ